MPNWCTVTWTITGPKADLDAIEAIGFDFEKIVPMPDILKQTLDIPEHEIDALNLKEKCGYRGWHEWRNANWGTKWNAPAAAVRSDTSMSRDADDTLVVDMLTAWSPPMGIIRKLSQEYPLSRFRVYCEGEGYEFHGIFVFLGGKLIKDTVRDMTDEEGEEQAAKYGY